MKNRQKFVTLMIVLLFLATACGPIVPPPPTPNFGTPDLTLTAIFSVLVTPATSTPANLIPTDTQVVLPSATAVQASATPDFVATQTSAAQTLAALATNTPPPPPTATFTFTPIPPTNTTVPTVTPTQPARSGPTLVAKYMTPNVDGSLGEWSQDWTNVTSVVFGGDNHSGAADLSAKVKVGWDWNFLYLAVQVTDDVYAQNASGENLFLGDSLEVLMDTNLGADFSSEALSSDDYQLGISGEDLVKDDGEAYLWFPEGSSGGKGRVQIQARDTDAGYRVEVAIPWGVFGVSPVSGMRYGFAFGVSDNDNPNANEQHSMISNVPDRRLTNPTTWGNLVLGQ